MKRCRVHLRVAGEEWLLIAQDRACRSVKAVLGKAFHFLLAPQLVWRSFYLEPALHVVVSIDWTQMAAGVIVVSLSAQANDMTSWGSPVHGCANLVQTFLKDVLQYTCSDLGKGRHIYLCLAVLLCRYDCAIGAV